jgi:hypothetical protein
VPLTTQLRQRQTIAVNYVQDVVVMLPPDDSPGSTQIAQRWLRTWSRLAAVEMENVGEPEGEYLVVTPVVAGRVAPALPR